MNIQNSEAINRMPHLAREKLLNDYDVDVSETVEPTRGALKLGELVFNENGETLGFIKGFNESSSLYFVCGTNGYFGVGRFPIASFSRIYRRLSLVTGEPRSRPAFAIIDHRKVVSQIP